MRHILIIFTLFLLSSQVFPQNTQTPSIPQGNSGEKQRISLAKKENKIGIEFWEKKDFALALEHFRLASELNPKKSAYFLSSGRSAKKLGRTEEAAQWFKQAVEVAVVQKNFKYIDKSNQALYRLYAIIPVWAEEKTLAASQLPETPEILQARKESNRLNLLIGKNYRSGNYTEALSLVLKNLQITKKNFGENHPYTITSLDDLARLYEVLGRYSDAESLQKKALRLNREVLGERHPSTLNSLNNLAYLFQSQGLYADAEALYLKVLALRQDVLGEKHPGTITTLGNLAGLYESQGRYSDTEQLKVKVLRLLQKSLGEKHPLTISAINNLASLYNSQGRYSEVEPLFEKGISLSIKVQGVMHPETLNSAHNLALFYSNIGRYSDAEQLFEKVLQISIEIMGEKNRATLTTASTLAELYRLQGRYADAEPLYKKTIRLEQETLGEKHPSTLNTLSNLALLFSLQGRYSEAITLNEKVLRIKQETLGEKHPGTLTSLNNLGSIYKDIKRYSDAIPLLEKGLRLTEEILGEKHPDTLNSLNNLAGLYSEIGRYADAEQMVKKELRLKKEVLGEKHPAALYALNNLAYIYDEQGNYSDAEPLYKKGVKFRQEVLGEMHPDTLTSLNNLAAFYQSQEQYAEAEIYWRKYLRQSNTFLDQVLWGAGESTRQSYLKKAEFVQNSMLSFYTFLNTPETAEESLYLSLTRKGLQLKISSGIKALVRVSKNPELQEQAEQLRSKKESLSNLTLAGPGDGNPQNFQLRLTLLKEDINSLEAALGREVQHLRRGKIKVTPQAVLKTLGEDEVLIDFIAYQQLNLKNLVEEGEKLMAVVVDKRQEQPIQLVFLGESEPIKQAVNEFRRHISKPKTYTLENVPKSGKNLHRLLWHPLKTFLHKKESVYLVPDGILHLLPFAALTDPEDLKYLAEKHNIVMLSSGRDLVLPPTKGETQNSVIFSSPIYNISSGKDIDLGEILGKLSITRGSRLAELYFAPLPGTGIEGNKISKMMLNQGNKPTLFSGIQATEDTLKQVNKPKILHLATHGFFLDNLPSDTVKGSGFQRGLPIGPFKQSKQPNNQQKTVLSKKPGILIVNVIKDSQASKNNLMVWDIVTEYAGEEIYSVSQFMNIVQSRSKEKRVWMTIERSGEKIQIELKGGRVGIAIQDIVSKTKQTSNSNNNPLLRTGLAFYGANQGVRGIKLPDGSDGILTAMEALDLSLNGTQLVVLSACETGVGDVMQGEGVFGLRRAFEEAGAHYVLSTLWSISDDGTQVFMNDFYNLVLQGENPQIALRTTQRAFIKNQQWSHPFYWAPFVMVGRE